MDVGIILFAIRITAIVLTSMVTLYALWLGAIALFGNLIPEKSYPHARPHTFAVIISARNEEKVIVQLIDSLNRQKYPQECYKIFVVAHNCTDKTAEMAENAGAEVIIRNADGEFKIHALSYGLDIVEERYGDAFEYVAVFDADALVDENFLAEINDVLDGTQADCASGYYASKNFNTNIISQLSGMLYHVLMCCNSMVDNRLNLPVNVYGSGYAFKFPWRRLFHQIDTIVDDFEFSCLMVLNRAKLVAAPKAVIYAEMPEKMQDALIQRQRWAFGDTQCYRKYRHDFRKAIVTHGMPGLKQYMDLVMNPVVFLTAFGLVLWILDAILHGIRVRQVIYGAIALIITYLVFELMALFVLKKESLQIRPGVKAMLLFPFWVLLSGWEAIVSVLKHDIEWKPTKRNSSKKIEDMKGAE